MIGTPLGGLDVAASAMSQALGDVFRGMADTQAQVPDIQAKAEALEGSRFDRTARMLRLPAELARDRQQLTLGEHAIKRAPYELDQLKQGLELGGLNLESGRFGLEGARTDRARQENARAKATEWIESELAKPDLPLERRQYLTALRGNPDAVMAEMGRRYESSEKFGQQLTLKGIESQNQLRLEAAKAADAQALARLNATLQKLTIEQKAAEGMTSQQAYAFIHKQKIELQEALQGVRAAREDLARAHAEFYRAKADYFERGGPASTKEDPTNKLHKQYVDKQLVALNAEQRILQQRVNNAARDGKKDPQAEAELREINRRRQELLSTMPGAPGAAPELSVGGLLGEAPKGFR